MPAVGGALDPDDLEVVLVVYRSRPHVEALLASWPTGLPVVVVDNSADTDGVSHVVAQHPACRYLDGGGQGFARAANLAAFGSTHDFVVFVNPDTRPTHADLLALTRGLAQDPTAASHAATVTTGDGAIEVGVGGWEPTVPRAAIHAVGLHKRFPRAGLFAKPERGATEVVDWTTGACMAVRTRQFATLAGFDEMFYVYAEDMSFGRRVRTAGLRQVLRQDVLVRHGAGNSGAPSREMMRLRGASFAYYLCEYHPPHRSLAVLGATIAGYAVRAAVAKRHHDEDLAGQYVQFIRGMMTRTATVGGTEVARRRHRQIVTLARPGAH
ncbi:MAG TPA: glycosyltransferase family 2 protein [Dermatophilaceae bacterium]|nr:glycosyltransferase family 2 protein [Dermatophilaceae bacterium]